MVESKNIQYIHYPEVYVGISSCLYGEKVRYDGGDKRNRFITEKLGEKIHFITVCPEVEVGMEVPREPVDLFGSFEKPEMMGVESETDWTTRIYRYTKQRIKQLKSYRLSGYILKSHSPSCGIRGIPIYSHNRKRVKHGRGIFADAVIINFPNMPVIEETDLANLSQREHFLTKVFAYHRLQNVLRKRITNKTLELFLQESELLLLSHSPKHYYRLKKVLQPVSNTYSKKMKAEIEQIFMDALNYKPTIRKNMQVFRLIERRMQKTLNNSEREELSHALEKYRRGEVGFVYIRKFILRYAHKYDIKHLTKQVYLTPFPPELEI